MKINSPTVLAQVTEAFRRYERALEENDTTVLGQLFWKSEATVRYGMNGDIGHGWEQIQSHRKPRSGPPSEWRRLSDTVITTFGANMATASTLFHLDQQPTMVGRQMQTWCKIEGKWCVVAAHVSWVEKR